MVNEPEPGGTVGAESATKSSSTSTEAEAQKMPEFNRPLRWFKLLCGVASAAGFGYGLRTAWVQAKCLRPSELPKATLLSGTGLAMQALGIATLITVSGYITAIVLISEAMGVNTIREFGHKTRAAFGDRFRIKRGSGENYASLREFFEAVEKQQSSDAKNDA